MADVSPELLAEIQKEYERLTEDNNKIRGLRRRLAEGTATYKEADEYAIEIGDSLAKAYGKVLSADVLPDGKMYYNIANAVVRPTLEVDHNIIAEYAAEVQNAINKGAGLGLKAIKPEVDQNRIQGLLDRLSEAEDYDTVSWILGEPVRNFSQNVVDDTVRANADFQFKSGLSPKIIRTAEPPGTRSVTRGKRRYTYPVPCKWCKDLAGTYDYTPKMPRDVFRRHEGCRCNVEYSPDGVKRQNAWTKKWVDSDTLEARKLIGTNTDSITPAERIMAAKRVQRGKDVTPVEDLRKYSNSAILNIDNHQAVFEYFKENYGIEIKGFNKKTLDEIKLTLAGVDDTIKQYPAAGEFIKSITYTPQLRAYGDMSNDGIMRIGKSGLGSYTTGLHETIHAYDYSNDISKSIIRQAAKTLELRVGGKDWEALVLEIIGWQNNTAVYTEFMDILAYSYETEKAGGKGNKLSKLIVELLEVKND